MHMSRKPRRKDSSVTKPMASDAAGIKWVMLIYFCSGACSLIDEVVWVRLLKLTLGNTVYASSIVVSVFMGGLALGALVMGRYADGIRRRLRLYALLEVVATVSALSLPWLLELVGAVYKWFFVEFEPSPTVLLFLQVVISTVVLLVPSTVMGSTLPLLGRYVTGLGSRVGRLVGRLYALNMLGAAIGCFLAGFVLIRLVGVMGTLYIAAGINMLVAFGGWMLSRSHESGGRAVTGATTEQQRSTATIKTANGRRYLLMAAFFTSGLVSIGYELVWMRSIVFLLRGFTYVFSAVLTIYLLGNVIGAWIGSRLSKRLRRPAVGFGVSLTCLGALGIFYIPWLSMWHTRMVPNITRLFGTVLGVAEVKAMIWPLFHTTFLFVLPAMTMGIGFPLALQAWSNYRHKVGQTTGTVYGVNTIGAVLGGLVTGFLLIPFMGVQLSITVLGLAGILLGAAMVQAFAERLRITRRLSHLAAATGLTVIAIVIPSDIFASRLVAAQMPETRLLSVKEGVTTTVSVHREVGAETLVLATSGLPVAGDHLSGVQKTLGHLGILLNNNTQEILSVGFGAGETSLCMSLHNLKRIDTVEIAPELVEVALKFFRHINLGEKLDEKVNMIYMDAKNYINLTQRNYDLIVNDCTDPKAVADNASLYTKEYFQAGLERLNPGGIFASYLPIRSIPVSCIQSIMGTFAEVFPYVTIWFPTTAPSGHDFFYLTGTREPQLFSPKYIDDKLRQDSIGESVKQLNFHNSHYVLSCYVGDKKDLKRYLREFELNSDFSPYIEFSIGVNESLSEKKQWFSAFAANVRRHESIFEHIDWTGLSQEERQKWTQEYELFDKVSGYLLASRMEPRVITRLWHSFNGLKIMPQHASLIEQEDKDLLTYPSALNAGLFNPEHVMLEIDGILRQEPEFGPAWLIKSWLLQQRNDRPAALNAAEKAVEYCPNTAAAHENAGKLFLEYRRVDRSIEHFAAAVRLMPEEPSLHFGLGIALAEKGQLGEAISQLREGFRLEPENAKIHQILEELLIRQERENKAVTK
jgi:spermidine synthase